MRLAPTHQGRATHPLAWLLQRGEYAIGLRACRATRLRHYLERPEEVPEWDDVECVIKWDVSAADGTTEWASWEGTAGTESPVSPAATHGATETDPITLEPVRAACMTRCGHVFSMLSIAKHLAMGAENADVSAAASSSSLYQGRCPICGEPVALEQLKPLVHRRTCGAHGPGDSIEMTLLCRPRDARCKLPLPRHFSLRRLADALWYGGDTSDIAALLTWHPSLPLADDGLCRYSRAVIIPAVEALYLRQRQEEEMLEQLTEDSSLHLVFEIVRSWLAPGLAVLRHLATEAFTAGDVLEDDVPRRQMQMAAADTVALYQAADGRPIFLHPLNFRCLLREYGSVERFPDTLHGVVVECEPRRNCKLKAESGTALPPGRSGTSRGAGEARTGYGFLAHLPTGCSFTFCELDLREYLSRDTYLAFRPELQARARARRQREPQHAAVHRAAAARRQHDETHRSGDGALAAASRRRPRASARNAHSLSRSLREDFEDERRRILEAHGGAERFYRRAGGIDPHEAAGGALCTHQPVTPSARPREWPSLGGASTTTSEAIAESDTPSPPPMATPVPPPASYANITQVVGGYFPDLLRQAETPPKRSLSAAWSTRHHDKLTEENHRPHRDG